MNIESYLTEVWKAALDSQHNASKYSLEQTLEEHFALDGDVYTPKTINFGFPNPQQPETPRQVTTATVSLASSERIGIKSLDVRVEFRALMSNEGIHMSSRTPHNSAIALELVVSDQPEGLRLLQAAYDRCLAAQIP